MDIIYNIKSIKQQSKLNFILLNWHYRANRRKYFLTSFYFQVIQFRRPSYISELLLFKSSIHFLPVNREIQQIFHYSILAPKELPTNIRSSNTLLNSIFSITSYSPSFPESCK